MNKPMILKTSFIILSVTLLLLMGQVSSQVWAGSQAQTVPTAGPDQQPSTGDTSTDPGDTDGDSTSGSNFRRNLGLILGVGATVVVGGGLAAGAFAWWWFNVRKIG